MTPAQKRLAALMAATDIAEPETTRPMEHIPEVIEETVEEVEVPKPTKQSMKVEEIPGDFTIEDSLPEPKDYNLAPEVIEEPQDLQTATMPVVEEEHIPEVVDSIVVPPLNIDKHLTTPTEPEEIDDKDLADMKATIKRFKKKAVDECLSYLEEQVDTKEFKDIVSIIDTIEKSIEPKKTDAPTIQLNVMVQNLMAGIPDDC